MGIGGGSGIMFINSISISSIRKTAYSHWFEFKTKTIFRNSNVKRSRTKCQFSKNKIPAFRLLQFRLIAIFISLLLYHSFLCIIHIYIYICCGTRSLTSFAYSSCTEYLKSWINNFTRCQSGWCSKSPQRHLGRKSLRAPLWRHASCTRTSLVFHSLAERWKRNAFPSSTCIKCALCAQHLLWLFPFLSHPWVRRSWSLGPLFTP